MVNEDTKPCLVQTGQGFSVKYKNRFLYSKYNPSKSILLTVNNLKILPDTLIFAISPAIGYGLNELLEKIPDGCHIILLEKDWNLLDFSVNQPLIKKALIDERISFLPADDWNDFPLKINGMYHKKNQNKEISTEKKLNKILLHHFKRCLKINLSGGDIFFQEQYDALFHATTTSIAQFWKNRITLVQFGKKYSKNIFKNLKIFWKTDADNIAKIFGSVKKNIIVFGAGEGIENILQFFLEKKLNAENFYVIAVDAALPCLSKANIKADLLVIEESQWLIKRLFIGNCIKAKACAASLSSFPAAAKNACEKIFFYETAFTNANYLGILEEKDFLPAKLPPLGSVGITAVEIATKIRKSSEIPIYVCGLDFSFSLGKTHANASFQTQSRFAANTRLSYHENINAAFTYGSSLCTSKNGKKTYSTIKLKEYATLFSKYFYKTKNIFDISKTGLKLDIEQKDLLELKNSDFLLKNNNPKSKNNFQETDSLQKWQKISSFYKSEIQALDKICEILENPDLMTEEQRNQWLNEELTFRDYLFIHFPDGEKLRIEIDFLKRLKAEAKYFSQLLKSLL